MFNYIILSTNLYDYIQWFIQFIIFRNIDTFNYDADPDKLINIENYNKNVTSLLEELDSVLNTLNLNDFQLNTIKQFLNK